MFKFFIAFVIFGGHQILADHYVPKSKVFCEGDLLHTVQMARINTDSKTFVDMKLRASEEITLNNFREWQANNPSPSKDDVRAFVDANFEPPASEFEDYTPTDFVENPVIIDQITDPEYRQFAHNLNDLWFLLGRKMTSHVSENPDLYSIIQVDNPVIVPGGRFREFYYWDSYWVVKGLLVSEMYTTVKGMIENFVSIVDRFGFVPNGGRVYYLGRSQPPLLIPIVMEYLHSRPYDVKFLRSIIGSLETEFQFWMTDKRIEVKGRKVAFYGDISSGPRPESYYEDYKIGANFTTPEETEAFYSEIKAAAESGMDFSSRWFINENGTNEGTLANLKVRSIAPVELNSILYWNAIILAEFFTVLRDYRKAVEYLGYANEIFVTVQTVFWHDDLGTWLDWDIINNQRRDYWVPSNLSPLWTGCFGSKNRDKLSQKILGYIKREGLDEYPGGVPNSKVPSGEQWDFPNVWPPMQHLLVVGLTHLETPEASELAYKWASKWVYTNYVGYNRTSSMFEKYSAVTIGLGGDGGEYDVQLGFGWSNGVILDFLKMFGDRLTPTANRDGRF